MRRQSEKIRECWQVARKVNAVRSLSRWRFVALSPAGVILLAQCPRWQIMQRECRRAQLQAARIVAINFSRMPPTV